jgi:hypothetical protein
MWNSSNMRRSTPCGDRLIETARRHQRRTHRPRNEESVEHAGHAVEILDGIRQGRAPLSIMNVQPGQEVDVELKQHEEKQLAVINGEPIGPEMKSPLNTLGTLLRRRRGAFLFRSDDPRNAEILDGIRQGRAPLSIMNVQPGQERHQRRTHRPRNEESVEHAGHAVEKAPRGFQSPGLAHHHHRVCR